MGAPTSAGRVARRPSRPEPQTPVPRRGGGGRSAARLFGAALPRSRRVRPGEPWSAISAGPAAFRSRGRPGGGVAAASWGWVPAPVIGRGWRPCPWATPRRQERPRIATGSAPTTPCRAGALRQGVRRGRRLPRPARQTPAGRSAAAPLRRGGGSGRAQPPVIGRGGGRVVTPRHPGRPGSLGVMSGAAADPEAAVSRAVRRRAPGAGGAAASRPLRRRGGALPPGGHGHGVIPGGVAGGIPIP